MRKNNNIEAAQIRVERWVAQFDSAVVAFSGGIDSALVLLLATRVLGKRRVMALTSVGPALASRERAQAMAIASEIGARVRCVNAGEIDDGAYRANGTDRCYHCKSHLYEVTGALREELAFDVVFNGTNTDDLQDYRPGLRAAAQAGVRAPLAECDIDKSTARAIAKSLGLSVWDKPASPCLASRVPYGRPVTRPVLAQIEAVEDRLHTLGFRVFRARHYGSEVRIEVLAAEIPRARELLPELLETAKTSGFSSVTVDPRGFVSGSLNRLLPVL